MTASPVRRRLLAAAALSPALILPRVANAAAGRVVIVGGGWGGLSAAAELRRRAPGLQVTLVDREAAFASFPLTNRWLVDHGGPAPMHQDYARIAAAHGWRFVQAGVEAVDRAGREVVTTAGRLSYDWLVLAPGIREDFSAWQVDDPAAVATMKRRFSGAMGHAGELPALKERLARFKGGDLLLTIPPMPYRCPPAPYERALLIAWWLKSRRIPGRLVIVDPNPLMPAFRAGLLERYRDVVRYLDHNRVHRVDVARQTVETDLEDIRFDEALLCPPQQAGDVVARAGLLRVAPDGRGDGWADVAPRGFRSLADPRVFVIGDSVGIVSPLFGHFPKTGHLAWCMGRIVAEEIAAEAAGGKAELPLPESVCHVVSGIEPFEMTRVETRYRRRGDGFLLQDVQQRREPNPAGEDAAWAAVLYGEFLAP